MEAGTKPPSDSCLPLHAHRELAYQIAEQFRVLGKPLGLKDCIIVGGMGMEEPKEALGMGLLQPQTIYLAPPLAFHPQTWWPRPWSFPGNHT